MVELLYIKNSLFLSCFLIYLFFFFFCIYILLLVCSICFIGKAKKRSFKRSVGKDSLKSKTIDKSKGLKSLRSKVSAESKPGKVLKFWRKRTTSHEFPWERNFAATRAISLRARLAATRAHAGADHIAEPRIDISTALNCQCSVAVIFCFGLLSSNNSFQENFRIQLFGKTS